MGGDKVYAVPFFRVSEFKVIDPRKGKLIYPQVKCEAHFLDLIALRLVKEGFGSWTEIEKMTSEDVMRAFHYCQFLDQYSETCVELNKNTET